MPSYHVEFTTPGGTCSANVLNAPSLPSLAQRLREEGCTLVRVCDPRPDPALRGYWRRVSEGEITTLLGQLALSLENGVSLPKTLEQLSRESRNTALRGMLVRMHQAVRDGDSLASALAAYPR